MATRALAFYKPWIYSLLIHHPRFLDETNQCLRENSCV